MQDKGLGWSTTRTRIGIKSSRSRSSPRATGSKDTTRLLVGEPYAPRAQLVRKRSTGEVEEGGYGGAAGSRSPDTVREPSPYGSLGRVHRGPERSDGFKLARESNKRVVTYVRDEQHGCKWESVGMEGTASGRNSRLLLGDDHDRLESRFIYLKFEGRSVSVCRLMSCFWIAFGLPILQICQEFI
jgi:hypothetical protein